MKTFYTSVCFCWGECPHSCSVRGGDTSFTYENTNFYLRKCIEINNFYFLHPFSIDLLSVSWGFSSSPRTGKTLRPLSHLSLWIWLAVCKLTWILVIVLNLVSFSHFCLNFRLFYPASLVIALKTKHQLNLTVTNLSSSLKRCPNYSRQRPGRFQRLLLLWNSG